MEEREIRNLRNHPTYMLETSWGALLVLVMVFFNGADNWIDLIKDILSGGSKELVVSVGILGGIICFFLIALFFSFRRWKKTTLTIADGSLTWEQNTIFSKRKEYAISTISNVNLDQNLFERIVGTYKLKLDTSSISTANETDMEIILGKKDAFAVRDLILFLMKHPEGVPEGQQGEDDLAEQKNENSDAKDYFAPISDDEKSYDFMISPGENFICALAGIQESQIFWLIVVFVGLIGMLIFGITHGQSLSGFFASALVLISLAYSLGKSVLSSFLRTYNYKVRREEEHIFVSSGAIKIRSYSVPVKQIQAVRFQSTLLGRLMGRISVSVINVSGEGDDVDGQWLFPPIPKEEIPQLMKQVLPEIPLVEENKMHLRPKRALVRNVLRTVIVMVLFTALAIWAYIDTPDAFYKELEVVSKHTVVLLVVLALVFGWVLWLVMDVVRQSTEKILILKERVAFRSGAFSWQQIEVPYDNIQMLEVTEDPIDRMMHLKRGTISLLAATVASKQNIPKFDKKDMESLQAKFRDTIM